MTTDQLRAQVVNLKTFDEVEKLLGKAPHPNRMRELTLFHYKVTDSLRLTIPNPHTLNRRSHIRHPEPDGLAHFEVGDQPAHAPVIELAAADFQMAGKSLFGDQVEFGARRRWVRVHARCCRVNVGGRLDRKI